ncbi:MAG: Clp protease N-terminal domain-containing protein [Acidimicrobiales bacterium]
MLDDLDAAAKRVIEIAGREAASLSHDFTGTEHILLGLVLCEDDVASRLLATHGIVAEQVRGRVARASGLGSETSEYSNSLTARAKQVLSLAGREADLLGDDNVRPEHLLLGIIRQETGVAALVLQDKGIDLAELRGEILELREFRDGASRATLFDGESSDAEDAEAAPELRLANPSCPNCGKRLSDVLAVASIAPVGASSGRRRSGGDVSVVFCGSCGHTLSAVR